MQDEEWIRRARQGEREFLDLLVDKYYKEVFRFCYYKVGDEQTAYDCAQETFLRMIRFLESYTEKHKFRSYLLRIALNVCRDYYRTNPFSTVSLTEFEPEADGGGGQRREDYMAANRSESGDFVNGQLEERYVIQQCLMRLPEFQREAIILHFYYGYKAREIADITGVPLATAKSRLKQGLDKLKKIFREEDLYEEKR